MCNRHLAVLLIALAAISGVAQAQPEVRAAVRARHANLGALLGAYKAVNAQLKQDTPNLAIIRAAADRMAVLGRQLPSWFPPGSGQESGMETNAKPEIWRKPAEFQAKAAAFDEAVDRLKLVAMGGQTEAIRNQQRAVSSTCTACHRAFEDNF